METSQHKCAPVGIFYQTYSVTKTCIKCHNARALNDVVAVVWLGFWLGNTPGKIPGPTGVFGSKGMILSSKALKVLFTNAS